MVENENKNAKALKIHSVILLIILRLCTFLLTVKLTMAIFKRSFLVKYTKYSYIHAQRVQINQNRQFVFGFTSLPVLTFFSTVILTGSWWRRTLNYNPIPSNLCRYLHAKFQENRIKTVAVTVHVHFQTNMAAVTSLKMLMSHNIVNHNPILAVIVCWKFHLYRL